jgi:hypothetical protein
MRPIIEEIPQICFIFTPDDRIRYSEVTVKQAVTT